MGQVQVKIGKISAVDAVTGMVSVAFADQEYSTTGYIPCLTHGEEHFKPTIGSEVLVICFNRVAVALGTYWNSKHAINMPENCLWQKNIASGSHMRYDREKNQLIFHAPDIVFETQDKTISLKELMERGD